MQRTPEPAQDTDMSPSAELIPSEGAEKTKKRPRLDMAVEPRERKRGKTMFGLLLGTLAKAKNEDKERNASDAVRPVSRLFSYVFACTDHICAGFICLSVWNDV